MTLPDELTALRAARSALEPSAADRERTLDATLAAAGGGAAPRFFVDEPAAAAPGVVGPAFLRRAAPYVAGAFLLGGVGGFYAGFSAGHRGAESAPVRLAPVAASVSSTARDAPPAVGALAPPPVTPTSDRVEGIRPAASVRASGVASSTLSPESSLEEELRALRRTERALRDHNPLLARALLAELDRIVPQGKLREERAAAATVAACQIEASPARAQQFASKFAASVHLERVRQACSAIGNTGAAAEPDSIDGL